MPIYNHVNEVKKSHPLPMAQDVGTCITCNYWEVETPRPSSEAQMVGVCVQHDLKDFALVVSGSSGCNHWEKNPEAGPEAERYAKAAQA
jgi:hypothetical protein